MNKVLRTALTVGLITGIVVFFITYKKGNTGQKTQIDNGDIEVKNSPEKQIVKPDDIIEESIIGDSSQEVVGFQTMIRM